MFLERCTGTRPDDIVHFSTRKNSHEPRSTNPDDINEVASPQQRLLHSARGAAAEYAAVIRKRTQRWRGAQFHVCTQVRGWVRGATRIDLPASCAVASRDGIRGHRGCQAARVTRDG